MRLLRSWGLGAGAAAALCVSAAVAVGQAPVTYPECTRKPTPQETEGAKGAHKAASQFYERAEYEKAVQYWKGAYEFDCTANDLLLNIANAYEKLGDRSATVATLETYLQRHPNPNPTIATKVKNLKIAMAQAAATATPTAPPTSTGAPTAPPPSTATPPDGARPHGFLPWIVVGGGGALALIGAILLPVGYGNIASAEEVCPQHDNCTNPDAAAKGNSGRTMAGVGWGMLSVGLAAAGGGLVWQLLFNKPAASQSTPPGQKPKADKKKALWVTPMAGPGTGGVTIGGSF